MKQSNFDSCFLLLLLSFQILVSLTADLMYPFAHLHIDCQICISLIDAYRSPINWFLPSAKHVFFWGGRG